MHRIGKDSGNNSENNNGKCTGSNNRLFKSARLTASDRSLPAVLLAVMIALVSTACGTPEETLDAQVTGPIVELAAVRVPVKPRTTPQWKIREVTDEQAFLSPADAQLRRAEYTDGIDVPVMSELIYEKIRVALDDKVDVAQLTVDLQPALKQGHWLMFFIDDQPAGAAIPVKKSSLKLPTLALGEHLLRVDILDETLMVLQSSRPHIIYVEEDASQQQAQAQRKLQQPLAAN